MSKTNQAAEVRRELLDLQRGLKALSADDVVKFAREHRDSACYLRFEKAGLWDDSVAAEIARREFARKLIMSVRVRVPSLSGSRVHVRGIVSLSEERDGSPSYRLRSQVKADPERLAKLRRDCASDIEAIARRYADVLALQEVEALRRVAASVVSDGGEAAAG